MAVAIELAGVTVLRDEADGSTRAVVHALDLSIAAGEQVALVGANGAGKTSLLLALVAALRFEGEIRIGELALGPRTLDELRRRVAFVFADPADQLFCATVHEEVAFGPRQLGCDSEETDRRVVAALGAVELLDHQARPPSALSLGQQRRLAIAAALAMHPDAILIDEPTASLDPVARRELLVMIGTLDATVLIATHDLDAVLDLNARTIVLTTGRLAADGPAQRILVDEPLLERAGLALPIAIAARRGA